MTRRGSIAYYFVAVACGCFFLAVSYYIYAVVAKGAPRSNMARDAIFAYFFTVLLGFLPQLLTAFVLRRTAARFKWHSAWQWVLAGTVLAMATLWCFSKVGLAVERWHGPLQLKTALMFLFIGPVFAMQQPAWLLLPAEAATAGVLFLVYRAFELQAASTTPPGE